MPKVTKPSMENPNVLMIEDQLGAAAIYRIVLCKWCIQLLVDMFLHRYKIQSYPKTVATKTVTSRTYSYEQNRQLQKFSSTINMYLPKVSLNGPKLFPDVFCMQCQALL